MDHWSSIAHDTARLPSKNEEWAVVAMRVAGSSVMLARSKQAFVPVFQLLRKEFKVVIKNFKAICSSYGDAEFTFLTPINRKRAVVGSENGQVAIIKLTFH